VTQWTIAVFVIEQEFTRCCGCVMLRVSSYGALVEYGCEKKITQFSNLSASLAVNVPNGVTLKLRSV